MMKHTQVSETTLKEKGQYDLIRGDFSPEDALEIMDHIFFKKITFHEQRSFSNEIRFGEPDKDSLMRCEELKRSKGSVSEMIQLATELGKTLRIKSSISIELI